MSSSNSFFDVIASWLEDIVGEVGDGYFVAQNGNRSSPGVQFIVSIVIGLVSIIAFSILRVTWRSLYSSKEKLTNRPPPIIPKTLFGWFVPLFKIKEEEVLDLVGLDSLMHLRFFKLSAIIFGLCSIYGVFVLIMITSFIPVTPEESEKGFDVTFRWSIKAVPEGSYYLVAHFVGVYIFSLITMFMLHREYQIFSFLRWNFLLKAKHSVTARSVLVEGIPHSLRNEQSLAKYFTSMDFGNVGCVRICHSAAELTRLVRKRADILISLESTITSWIGNPCIKENYNPQELEEAISHSKLIQVGEKERPQVKAGFFGIVGNKLDAINHKYKQIKDIDASINLLRLKDNKFRTTGVGFVTFKDIRSAHLVSQVNPNSIPFRLRTELAPEPRDIYWANLGITAREQSLRRFFVYVAVGLVTFFYTIPLSVISSLLQIEKLVKVLPFLKDLQDASPYIYDLLSGFLPTVATITFIAITPLIFTGLTIVQGNKSISSIERDTISKHYLFLFVNVLLVFTISTTFIKTIFDDVLKNPTNIPNLLAGSLPEVAPFFVNYVMILGIGYFPLQLVQLGPVFFYFYRRIFSKTPRDFAELLAPSFIDYGWLLGQPLLVFTLTMTYSVISPLILVVGTCYYVVGHFVNKYIMLYVAYRNYETGGMLWPCIFNRIMVGVFLKQLLMTGYFGLKNFYPLSIAMLPLIIFTSIFAYYMPKAYPNDCKYLPADYLINNDNTTESLLARNDLISSANLTSNLVSEPYMDDQQYIAEPNVRTDYSQSTMLKFYGVLDSGIEGYGNPAIHGTLPKLWLPQKIDPKVYQKLLKRRTCFCCSPISMTLPESDQDQSNRTNINSLSSTYPLTSGE
ncbi:DUF221-domain-containing protein [Neoconidiobolus thromboides FSU 785]|nr:DUF221-domain-containing protein [Neoconidiobolus thromboides FSU 785]